jgi:hypothetical protein
MRAGSALDKRGSLCWSRTRVALQYGFTGRAGLLAVQWSWSTTPCRAIGSGGGGFGTRRSRGGLLGRCGSLRPCLSSSGAMPRRPPAVVRAALARHPRRRDQPFSVVDGVSAGTLREIRSWELSRGRPGEVARDLAWWGRQANEMSSRHWHGSDAGFYYYGYFGCPCCDDDPPRGRWGLEEVLQVLSRRARREMAAVVGALDARVLARTYGSEPSAPGWWESRI